MIVRMYDNPVLRFFLADRAMGDIGDVANSGRRRAYPARPIAFLLAFVSLHPENGSSRMG